MSPYHTPMDAERETGWTGGQMSIVRIVVALGAIHLSVLAFLGTGSPVVALCAVAAVLTALALIPDLAPPWTAAGLAVVLAVAASDLPHPGETSVAATGALALIAAAPFGAFGSRAARGRVDPGGGWTLPRRLASLAPWILVGLHLVRVSHHLSSGHRGLAIAHAAVAALWLARRARPAAWTGGLVVDLVDFALLGAPATLVARLMLRLLAADPRWLGVRRPGAAVLLYDGSCGLCHRTVRLCLAEAPDDAGLSFAPLGGEAARARLGDAPALPDSLVLLPNEGATLLRSSAVIAVLERLGGLWRVLALALRVIPRPLRDLGYDLVARVRHRLFDRPSEACPIVPQALRTRFLP